VRNLLPIGRFAAITRLSVKTLRHYDEAGLLRPALVDAGTGYRYYAAAQAVDAERIRLLRALEVPLEEIGAILRESRAEAIRERLDSHRERLEARVEEDRRRIATLLRLSQGEEVTMAQEIVLREVEAQPVLGLRAKVRLSELGPSAGRAFGLLYTYLGGLGARPAGAPLGIYHCAPTDDDVFDVEWCVPTDRVLVGKGELRGHELPAVTAACVRHAGPYDEVGPCYAALQAWMQQRGHEQAGPPREVYVVGGPGTPPAELRTEIQWPVVPDAPDHS
jgi:DNA-binding transcriptional MerR regulator